MSIKGFQIDGAVQRYDYTALDNKPVADATLSVSGGFADAAAVGAALLNTGGGGLTDDAKEALLNCFAHVAWADATGGSYYDMLEDALYNTTWRVTRNLTNCTINNATGAVAKGASYSATLAPIAGYTLTGATVSVTMGGTDITSTAYSNGTITIGAVTGVLVITASAAASSATLSSISAVYTQSGTVYASDTLDSLKADLAVTASYDDTSTAAVPAADYTLSGTLAEGTSTVTVTYGGKTTTFTVTVSAARLYQQVEYIEATGTQALVLDSSFAAPSSGISAVIECSATKASTAQIVIGIEETAGNWFGLGANVNFGFGATAGVYFEDVDPTTFHTYNVVWGSGTVSATCGAETVSRTYTNKSGRLSLLCGFSVSAKKYFASAKVKSCKITVDGVLLYDLIPVYRISDNVIGMLNLVDNTFFTNAGTGTFLKGDNV